MDKFIRNQAQLQHNQSPVKVAPSSSTWKTPIKKQKIDNLRHRRTIGDFLRRSLTSLKTLHNGGKDNDVDSNQQSFGAKGIIQVIRNQSTFKIIAKAFAITVAVKM